ncbi:MAG: inositol monophosphatase family protein [bacterium]|nr:inositol monophosphatase family protein [bacterium]
MIETLERAVRECGDLLLKIREKGLRTEDKNEQLGAHFSTQGDTLSQARGIEILREKFPDEIVIAEEFEFNDPRIPPDCTVFDPADGTTIYYNGCREFGVTMCSLRRGQPDAGVMYFPVDRMMISAVRGRGCFINGSKFTIRWDRPLDKTLVGTDVGPWTAHEVLQPLSKHFCVRSIMAAIYGARAVLLGETGMYYNLNIAKIWDAAAGALAVEEAGGVVCAPDGSPLRWNTISADWILAVNQPLADALLVYTRVWHGRTVR